MGYRAIIREIRIKNFRSIVEATIPLDNFNIFVGLNDCGKSNVLKALNLFFIDLIDGNLLISPRKCL